MNLFGLAEKKLAWLSERQSVLASNIANVNTPAYRGADIQSFATVLAGLGNLAPSRTQAAHMAGTVSTSAASVLKDPTPARSMDGNSVAIDDQLTKVADTESSQNLVTSIWRQYVSMFNVALGKGG